MWVVSSGDSLKNRQLLLAPYLNCRTSLVCVPYIYIYMQAQLSQAWSILPLLPGCFLTLICVLPLLHTRLRGLCAPPLLRLVQQQVSR